MYLFDTHTHFDVPEYNNGRDAFNAFAYHRGVRHVILIGYLAKYFPYAIAMDEKSHTGRFLKWVLEKDK